MRKLIVSMMVSADGYFASHGETDWFVWDDETESYMLEFLGSVGALLYGRKAYEEMVAYWPTSTQPIAKLMNALPKLVLSRTLRTASWNNTRVVREGIEAEISMLKLQSDKDLVLFAGANAASSVLNARLADEVRLMVNPVILGAGRPAFAGLASKQGLRLSDVRRFACGNLLLRYDVEG